MHAARESRKGARLRLSTQEGKTEICLWFFYWHMLMWNLCYMHICAQLRLCLEIYVIMLHLLYHFYFFNCFGTFLCRGCVFLITLALLFLVSKTLEGEACERIRNPDHTEKSKKEHLHLAKNWSFSVLIDFTTFACVCKKCLLLCACFFLLQERPREADVQTIQRKVRKMCQSDIPDIWCQIFVHLFFSFFFTASMLGDKCRIVTI